jgi:hypothetical protein
MKIHGATNQEFDTEQGFPAAGTAADQGWPSSRQTAQSDLVKALDTGRAFREAV